MITGILLLCFSFMVNFKNIKILVILLRVSVIYYDIIVIVVLEVENYKILHYSAKSNDRVPGLKEFVTQEVRQSHR